MPFSLWVASSILYTVLFMKFSVPFKTVQARILALNASYFLKSGGHFVISIKVGSNRNIYLIHDLSREKD